MADVLKEYKDTIEDAPQKILNHEVFHKFIEVLLTYKHFRIAVGAKSRNVFLNNNLIKLRGITDKPTEKDFITAYPILAKVYNVTKVLTEKDDYISYLFISKNYHGHANVHQV